MRTRFSLSRVLAAATTVATFTLAGCGGGGGDGPTGPPGGGGAGGFTLSASVVSVQAGASGNSTITIARTAPFTGAVALSAAAPPAGVTVTLSDANPTGTTSTAAIAVASSVAPGAYTVTINGTGSGVSGQSTQIAVTVTGGTPQPTNVVFNFCAGQLPTWLAFQATPNGTWTRVTTGGPSYTMPITDRGGVAYVRPGANGGFETSVYYGTTTELNALGGGLCGIIATGTKTLFGSVAGMTANDQAAVLFGHSAGFVLGTQSNTFSMFNVADGAYDLLAVRRTLNQQGTRDLTKIIIRRNFNPPTMSTVPAFDFEGTEARTPASANLTVTGMNGEATFVTTGIVTSRGFIGTIPFDINSASTAATQRYYGLAADQRVAGDLHVINAFASTQQGTGRTVTGYFTDIVDRSLGLGPALGTATVTVTSTPFARPRVQLASQAEYASLLSFSLDQGVGADARGVDITATAGYFGGTAPATWDVTLPDFAGASYDATWALRTGTAATGTVAASGFIPPSPIAIPGGAIAANTVVRNGSRNVSVTP